MNKRDSLGDRMKIYYESVPRIHLTRRTPVIIRLDGKAFHTFTRGFDKPYDLVFMGAMQETMRYLCANIQGCVLGYTQSDEITLVLTDYATLETCPWFDYNVQKMCSVAASMATLAFNRAFAEKFGEWSAKHTNDYTPQGCNLFDVYDRACNKGALFDARVFNIPKEEVCNCLIWRQQDAIRNSIQSLGQSYFSQKELNKKSCADILEMLRSLHGLEWESFSTRCQRGSCCRKMPSDLGRSKWTIDNDIPLFTEDREYVNNLI